MRIAVGGIYHESNSFFSERMTLERFAESQLHYGEEIFQRWAGTCSEMAGFLKGAERFGFEPIATLMAWGMPSGVVTSDTFEILVGDLVARIEASMPLDGVLLSLHGAMVSESFDDADGEILRRVRAKIGSEVPLIATLDFHANLTEQMVRWADALVVYDTYPHVDQVERGLEAADIMRRMLREGLRVRMALARRPLLPHILTQCTDGPPMADILSAAHECENSPEIVCVSVAAGFSYTDVPQAGFAVVAVAESQDAADTSARSVADLAWRRRIEFGRELPDPKTAVKEAISAREGLTVLVDVGDNLGAGTPGDGTILLQELLREGAQDALVLLCDPESVDVSIRAGVRSKFSARVGGKRDAHHGAPVEVNGTVRLLSDGIYRNVGFMREGVLEDQGRTAVIDAGGVVLVLTERRMPMWNLQQLRSLGIEPTKLKIVVVKAAIAYRAAYAPIANKIIEVNTPGLSAADVKAFNYKKLARPIYPLDET
ncbi:MAG TPA: M81 family metallopeptidase [Terriglobales bacterium]|nr:M81 family metallopeptidase [Terriglobales bacterium]